MKGFKRVVLAILALATFSVIGVSATEEKEMAYYVINEDFSLPQPNSWSSAVPSSWDADTLAGGLSVSGNRSFAVMDDSEKLSSTMRRVFNAESGKITLEFTIIPSDINEGTVFELRSGETTAIGFVMTENALELKRPTGDNVVIGEMTVGRICGIKAQIDIPSNTFILQINGQTNGTTFRFLNPCEQLDTFFLETGREGTGTIGIGTVRISNGFSVNEKFITSPYALPDDWTKDESAGTIAAEQKLGSLYPDVYSLRINDDDFLGSSSISRTFTYDGEELWLEYQFLIPEQMDEFNMILGQGNNSLITLGNKKSKFGYWLQNGEFQEAYDLKDNVWYHVMLKLTEADGGKLYINHKLVADKIELPFLKVDSIRFETGKTATGYIYLDDILLKSYYPYPDDYVPEPDPPEHGDYIVGMQSCNMWKEGSHFGWDWINPFEERHSYMGFYDEGSPEVKDWEIKWMLEHGIDYELFCWYRPPAGNNQPIKYPRNAYALHEGFMNTRYKDRINFAIAWENGSIGVSGSQDFRENVVPFWMEQYFKDPSYLVVDNKPVVSIYNFSRLKEGFGSVEGIRAEMDYLRQACIDEGFDGCIILMSSSTMSETEMQEMSDAGIDCIYNYSWGQSAAVVETQMANLEKQRDLGGVDMMVTMSMGRDDTPWERNAGGFASVEDFRRLVEWSEDTFIPSLPADSLGKRFVMFGNWNEYGEGHFLSPTNLHGFEYLDAIRDVYTGGGEHEDISPTEGQKARFTHLYVQDRQRIKPYSARHVQEEEEVPDNVKLGYYFDEATEGWTVAKQVDNFRVENGAIAGTSNNTDPGVYSPANLDLVIGDVTHIRIRMKTSNSAASVTLYYITNTDASWAESKSFKGTFTQVGDEMYELILPTAGSNTWKGKLTQMRLDPITETGDFAIDSVELLSRNVEGGLQLLVDGEQQFFTRPLVMQNDSILVPAAEFSDFINVAWGATIDNDAVNLLDENGRIIHLPYGQTAGKIDDEVFTVTEPACLIDHEVYYPLRSVAEALGYKVEWNNEENAANVITQADTGEGTISAPTEPDALGTFNFNTPGDTQGWSAGGNMTGASVSGGVFSFRSTGTDPTMTYRGNIDAAQFPIVNVRVKNQSNGSKLQMYFATTESPSLSESQSVSVTMEPNGDEFVDLALQMSENDAWKGTVTQLRLDPTDSTGKMEIEYIILSDQVIFSGGSGDGKNILSNALMDWRQLEYTTDGATANYTADTAYIGRYSLRTVKEEPDGALLIPAPMQQDKLYTYTFWVNLPTVGSVEIGTVAPDGSRRTAGTAEIAIPQLWTKVTGSFTYGEASDDPMFYILSDTASFCLDGIALREEAE